MKALIVMIATLFTLTVAADRTYQETLKKIERDAHKAKLQAANAYLKRLQAAQDKAMQDKDLKRANLLQAEIDKLKKSYGSKKKDVTVATVKPVQEDVTGRWDITVLHKGRHILLNKDKTAFYSDGVKGTWVIKGTDVTITWTNNTTWLMKLKGDGMSGKDLRGRAVAVVRAVTQMPFELGTYVVPRSGTLITLNSDGTTDYVNRSGRKHKGTMSFIKDGEWHLLWDNAVLDVWTMKDGKAHVTFIKNGAPAGSYYPVFRNK